MTDLKNKIDFAVLIKVVNANPNGDPLNGNRPRVDYDGRGEITDVCLKRKIRDRIQEMGYPIFVQSDERRDDEYRSLSTRARGILGDSLGGEDTVKLACQKWFDVRTFGNLFAIKGNKTKKPKKSAEDDDKNNSGDTGVSIGIRGPVTIQSAFSIAPIEITSTQITKSVSGEGDGTKRSSDTMGMKHRVDKGIYVTYGSINPQLAEKTHFSEEDANVIKSVLPRLFENDASSSRPDGSMEVLKVIWWTHGSKAGSCSSAKAHKSLTIKEDGEISIEPIENVKVDIINGF